MGYYDLLESLIGFMRAEDEGGGTIDVGSRTEVFRSDRRNGNYYWVIFASAVIES
jgi:hypothetical protein